MSELNGKTVLVVDDDESLRQMYRLRLEASGYAVVEATNGEEAMARAVDTQPSCILLDIMMPRVNGFDVLDILKTTASTKKIPVVVLTALMQDDARKRVQNAGAAACLVKSEVVPAQVVATIDAVLAKPTT
ncbi:MAG: response regulator [Patescibacteria group bacterium]|jgi:CheY-like chemotaxis protein